MTPRLALALLRRAGFPVLASVALGWWAYHLDRVTREERKQAEERYSAERAVERKEFFRYLKEVADACVKQRAPRLARDEEE